MFKWGAGTARQLAIMAGGTLKIAPVFRFAGFWQRAVAYFARRAARTGSGGPYGLNIPDAPGFVFGQVTAAPQSQCRGNRHGPNAKKRVRHKQTFSRRDGLFTRHRANAHVTLAKLELTRTVFVPCGLDWVVDV